MSHRVLAGVIAGLAAIGVWAALAAPASAHPTSSRLAPHIGGLMDRGNTTFKVGSDFSASPQQAYLNGDTFTVTWDAIAHGATKPASPDFSMIDDALANLDTWTARNPQRKLRLRIYAGTSAPEWVKNLAGGPVPFYNEGDPDRCPDAMPGCALTIPRYWTPAVLGAWNQMIDQLAAHVDHYYADHPHAVQVGEITPCEAGFASCEPTLSFADFQGELAHPNGYYFCTADPIDANNPEHSGYNYDREKAIYADYHHMAATFGSLRHWKPRIAFQVEPYQEVMCPADPNSTPDTYKAPNDNGITQAFIDGAAGTTLPHNPDVRGGSFTLPAGGVETDSPSLAVFFHTGLGPSITCYFTVSGCANDALQAQLYAYILNLYVPSTQSRPRGDAAAYPMWGQTKPAKKLGDQWPDTLCFAVESGLMSVELPFGYTGFDTEDPTTCPYTYHGYTGTPPTGTAHDLLLWANTQTIANAATQDDADVARTQSARRHHHGHGHGHGHGHEHEHSPHPTLRGHRAV